MLSTFKNNTFIYSPCNHKRRQRQKLTSLLHRLVHKYILALKNYPIRRKNSVWASKGIVGAK